MRYVAFDSETVPFQPGVMAPPLVCVQYQPLERIKDPDARVLVTRASGALEHARRLLVDPDVTLIGHNLAFDGAVLAANGLLPEVFAAYKAGRMVCTWVYERLGEIAGATGRKNLSLDVVMAAHGLPVPDIMNAKTDDGRPLAVDFGQFLDAREIPPGPHRDYALQDTDVGKLFLRQYERFTVRGGVPMSAVQSISYTMFWLQLMSVWGLGANAAATAAFRQDTETRIGELREVFTQRPDQACTCGGGREHAAECPLAYAFLRPNGSCMVKDRLLPAVARAYAGSPPRTPTGQPQRSAMVLSGSGDPLLAAFADHGALAKSLGTDLPILDRGLIHPRYGLADTGRTTCSNPNLQNLPGDGLMRGCLVAEPGTCFLERDYSGVELCTFAAVGARVLGDTSMADEINQSGDPAWLHAVLGGRLLGVSPEELLRRRKAGDPLAENARTRAKNGNFGLMGGMGAATFATWVRTLSKGQIQLSLAEARELKKAWGEAIPVGPRYLKWVSDTEKGDGTYDAEIPGLGIVRRGIWYSAAANARFQGLAAAIMHEAGKRLAEACYLPGGELYGVRPVLFVHDAFTLSAPDSPDDLTEVDRIFSRILDEAARHVMPEVLTKSEGHAAYSLAKRVGGQKVGRETDEKGRLVPWENRTR